MRMRVNPTSSKSMRTPAITIHHTGDVCPALPLVVEPVDVVEPVEVVEPVGVVEPVEAEEPVGVVEAEEPVSVACCPGDGEVAVKENWPLVVWPSAEVTRQATVYRPAGEPVRRCSVTVLSTKTAEPV